MKKVCNYITGVLAGVILLSAGASRVQAQYSQGFNGTALPSDWTPINRSTTNATGNPWTAGPGIVDSTGTVVVAPQEGNGYAIANYSSTGSTGTNATISNWLISPQFSSIKNGDTFSFYTTTTPGSQYPDRLQFRLSTAGASTNVGTGIAGTGDFSVTLLELNATQTVGGYPDGFTLETVTISGLATPVSGRVAFRYYVTQGGSNGANSNIIGVDAFSTTASVGTAAVPEPSTCVLAGLGGFALLGVVRARRRVAHA